MLKSSVAIAALGLTLSWSGLAFAKSMQMVVMIDPFTQANATLNVPEEVECKDQPGHSIHVRICNTPGAELSLDNGPAGAQIIPVSKSQIVTSTHAERIYLEHSFTGTYTLAGKNLAVRLEYTTKDGVPFPGTLTFHRNLQYPVVMQQ